MTPLQCASARRLSPAPLLLACLLPLGCGGNTPSGESAEAAPPPVILIVLDTVRADSLSCYGGPAGATPTLDALAAQADRYEVCVSSAPWTLPSHASMFTGLYPHEHGAHSFLPDPNSKDNNVYALHPKTLTLAEHLSSRGYVTGGVVANAVYLRPGLGLDAGFSTWDVHRQTAPQISIRALQWLDDYGMGQSPSFLFVNYIDAHRPYATGVQSHQPAAKLDELITRVMKRGQAAAELGDEVRQLHQQSVTVLDGHLGRFFDALKERDLFDRSLIIVTSDHGEAFGGHGIVEHSKDLYEDLVRVPLIVKRPGQTKGRVLGRPSSSTHIPRLVASAFTGEEAAAIEAAFPRDPEDSSPITENYFSRRKDLRVFGQRFRRTRKAIYDGPLKLIVGSDGSVELYNLAQDPEERNDLSKTSADDVARLRELLDAELAAGAFEGPPALPDQLTPEQHQDMRDFGYAGGDK